MSKVLLFGSLAETDNFVDASNVTGFGMAEGFVVISGGAPPLLFTIVMIVLSTVPTLAPPTGLDSIKLNDTSDD